MNKNIKKIVAFTVICTAFSTCIPSTMTIGIQSAYAYSDDEITSLKVTSGVSGTPIYSSISHKEDYRIKSGEKVPIVVYSKISSEKTNIKLSTIETKAADIRVFVGKDNSKLADIHNEIKIAEGEKKSIFIRLYDSKTAANDAYTTEYELIVEREISDEDETEAEAETVNIKDYDDIYLTKLTLSNNDNNIACNFDKTQPIYDINVDDSISYIKIKAVPEQEGYKLLINDKEVDTKGSNKDIRELFLDKGPNLIKIRIISSDHERREYFLNITRGKTASQTTDVNTTDNQDSHGVQPSGWLYRKADGTMATGWICIGNEWYYFDLSGAMKTGWLQDTSGKWYYLKESGVMAKGTVINGYKIGADGVYITK